MCVAILAEPVSVNGWDAFWVGLSGVRKIDVDDVLRGFAIALVSSGFTVNLEGRLLLTLPNPGALPCLENPPLVSTLPRQFDARELLR
jgi:hypothetical protein